MRTAATTRVTHAALRETTAHDTSQNSECSGISLLRKEQDSFQVAKGRTWTGRAGEVARWRGDKKEDKNRDRICGGLGNSLYFL